MTGNNNFDVLIIGGSYAGLSAAMALGRSLRKVLTIDSGKPCNRNTPHSHNFITHDGNTPSDISLKAKEQVLKYETVTFYDGLATSGRKTKEGFAIATQDGKVFTAKKLIFATGIKDIMPDMAGFSDCWGISILHCPYCHGYEVRNEKTGILGNGNYGFEFSRMISNWTKDLTLFTNGEVTLTHEQMEQTTKNNIGIVKSEIDYFEHDYGKIRAIVFKDGSSVAVKAVYAKPQFVQHSDIPESLGCELTEQGLLQVNEWRRTTVEGVFACGDNSSLRSVASAVYTGSVAGAGANKELIEEEF